MTRIQQSTHKEGYEIIDVPARGSGYLPTTWEKLGRSLYTTEVAKAAGLGIPVTQSCWAVG
jgi:hypothetical protein